MGPEGLGKLERELAAGFIAVKRKAALSAAQRSVALMQTRTRRAIPANQAGIGDGGAFNYGTYARSWRAVSAGDGNAVLFNFQKYAGVIELGRRTGTTPPIAMIARWAQRRLQLDEDEAARAAYPIARAIARRGLLGRHVMSAPEALNDMAKFFVEEFTHELDTLLSSAAGRP
jgi:hypothetical protein